MRELAYIEGKNILIEYRYGEGKLDRIPSLVGELVQLKVDVLVVISLSSIRAAKPSDLDDSDCYHEYPGSSRVRDNR